MPGLFLQASQHFDELYLIALMNLQGGTAFQQDRNFHKPNHEAKQIYGDLQSCQNSVMDENIQKRLVAGKPHTIGLNQ